MKRVLGIMVYMIAIVGISTILGVNSGLNISSICVILILLVIGQALTEILAELTKIRILTELKTRIPRRH